MIRTARIAALLLCGVLAVANSVSAAVIVDKVPDVGTAWAALDGGTGTFVYANSFVFTGTTGDLVDTIGVYMLNYSNLFILDPNNDTAGTPVRFELLADSADSPGALLAATSYLQVASETLALVTNTLSSAIALTNGTRYWIAASVVGKASQGAYAVGGHTQNSIYPDNGTFFYSNNPAGTPFDQSAGSGLTPEMAIYAAGPDAPPPTNGVPEPASLAIWGLGFVACAFGFRRRKVAA